MANKAGISVGKKGMNRNTHPGELGQEEYTFALNSNFQDEHGNGKVLLTNEPSNLKCSGFKQGFKVIGFKFDRISDQIFFFLVNPTTGCSEIGYIDVKDNIESVDALTESCKCNIRVVLEDPLENIIQDSLCEYNTLISDYCISTNECTGCLNFSIDTPIKESNIHIKTEKTGKFIYWTDGNNPQRYLNLNKINSYFEDVDDCTGEVTEVCLKCEELRLFKETQKPCIRPRVIQNGGNLRAGLLEVLIAPASITGDELGNYLAITNPIAIYDVNNNILDQTNLDYQTNQAVAIEIVDFDTTYAYFKIAVVYRSGLDGSVTYYNYGVYPSDTKEVTINSLLDKSRTDLQTLVERRPFYTKAKGLSVNNGYLFQYGLESIREINLQPVVNLMGGFAKWITYQGDENLYEDGVFISNYTGYLRGETYPYSFQPVMDGGHELPLFTFIARPPYPNEIEILDAPGSSFVSNTNTDSINQNTSTCSETGRDRRWQFEDTSTVDEASCPLPAGQGEYVTEERLVESSCIVSNPDGTPFVVDSIASSFFEYESELGIVEYINLNADEIIASTGPNGSDIRDILNTIYPQDCTPSFGDNCGEESLKEEMVIAIDVDTETSTKVYLDFEDYSPRVLPPAACDRFEADPETGNLVIYQDFVDDYMNPSDIVYKRVTYLTNTTCSSATSLQQLFAPQLDTNTYFKPLGQIGGGINTLQSTENVSSNSFNGVITLTGNLGTANINIGGTNYLATFSGSLATTASNFVATHGPVIAGLTLTASGNSILLSGPYTTFSTTPVSNVSGNLSGDYDNVVFTSKLHQSALWYKADFVNKERISVELSPTFCNNPDDNTYKSVRISVFDSCPATSDIPVYSRIIDDMSLANDPLKWVELLSSDFGGITGTAYFVIDTPIRHRNLASTDISATILTTCGCFNIYKRDSIFRKRVEYTNLDFGKRQVWESLCEFTTLKLDGCGPVPYQSGKFSYVESSEKYPCNPELYDSSWLIIPESSIPSSIKDDFEDFYTTGSAGGNYILNTATTNFMDQGIRHFKYPDNTKVPFMSDANTANPGDFKPATIYPIGFFLSNEVINAFLDIAVLNGLITIEERVRIKKYNIYRGDRSVDRSIIAKGLLFDMYKYQDFANGGSTSYYPNYPLNTLGTDLKNGVVFHKNASLSNSLFTFHSPDTSFYKPTLTRELLVEGYQFGKARNFFDEVMDHSTWVVLGQGAFSLATGLAIAEAVFEILLQSFDYGLLGTSSGTIYGTALGIVLSVVAIVAIAIGGMFKAGEYRYRWLETITNFGSPKNFAYYSVAIGHYNNFLSNQVSNSILRGLSYVTYLKDGYSEVPDETTGNFFNVNNFQREESVFLGTGESMKIEYPSVYVNYDNESVNPSNSTRGISWAGTGRSGGLVSNAASPYVSLKQYLPSQYGQISSIKWMSTNYCGDLETDNSCLPVWGGDTFISRFALKRKFPYFTSTAHRLPPLTPFKYSDYFNINNGIVAGRKYIDYLLDDDETFSMMSFVFPGPRNDYTFADYLTGEDGFYVKPPTKFYLYSYGIPYFLCESVINSNFRYAKRELHENFYPNIKDVIRYTQESNVSINEPNTYFYNFVYSTRTSFYPWRILPNSFREELYEGINDLTNTLIYSGQDNSESALSDPWLQYKALDTYQFPTSNGNLISIDSLESEQLLARFEHGFSIFGAVDVIKDRVAPETAKLGTGGIFTGRKISFNETDLGYAGTQHTAMVSCEFGKFWCDSKRGEVFHLEPNAKGLNNIEGDLDKWFKEHLPFKITNYIPDINTDNGYNGVGLEMGWDNRLKRVFITKKDYLPKSDICYSDGKIYQASGYDDLIASYTAQGYTYTGISGCTLTFVDEKEDLLIVSMNEIQLTDSEFFYDISWTVAYSPLLKSWISYYSFKPNYYVNLLTHFKTGINTTNDSSELGLWSHFSFLTSYQVFYGKLYPWIIEVPKKTDYKVGALEYIKFFLDVRKYYNRYDVSDVYGVGFNKAWVYNMQQNTGQLNLVHQKENNMFQVLQFPKHNTDSIDILQTEINGEWSFNYLYNAIRNEKSGLPAWINDPVNIDKTINTPIMDYRNSFKDRLKGDYFLIRLQQDVESRFKMIFRFLVSYEKQ